MADDKAISDALHKQHYSLLIIGSRSKDGEPNGMTANWGMQVSFEPRIYAVAIEQDAHTRSNIEETGYFSVSIIGEDPGELPLKFTKKSTSGDGRLEGEPMQVFETGTPVLDAAVAWIECRVVSQTQAGDHIVFFGEVVNGGVREGDATTLAATGLSYAG